MHSHFQLHDQLSMKSFLPTFNFLGSLIEAVPDVAHRLVTQHGETIEQIIQLGVAVSLYFFTLVYK